MLRAQKPVLNITSGQESKDPFTDPLIGLKKVSYCVVIDFAVELQQLFRNYSKTKKKTKIIIILDTRPSDSTELALFELLYNGDYGVPLKKMRFKKRMLH